MQLFKITTKTFRTGTIIRWIRRLVRDSYRQTHYIQSVKCISYEKYLRHLGDLLAYKIVHGVYVRWEWPTGCDDVMYAETLFAFWSHQRRIIESLWGKSFLWVCGCPEGICQVFPIRCSNYYRNEKCSYISFQVGGELFWSNICCWLIYSKL